MKRRGGGEDNEKHNHIRKKHAGDGIVPRIAQFVRRRASPFRHGLPAERPFFLDFLRCLPEKQVR